MDQSERLKSLRETVVIREAAHFCEVYLQELDQVLKANSGEKSPYASHSRREKRNILK